MAPPDGPQRLAELARRVAALDGDEQPEPVASAEHARVEAACHELALAHRFYRVPPDYYDKGLAARAALLHAPSVHHLCKSVLVKNTAWEASDPPTRANAEYYLVIVQYTRKMDGDKLWRAVRLLLPKAEQKPKNKFVFRLATQAESDAKAGFRHNAVAPVGLRCPDVPLLVSSSVTRLDPPVIYLGGGEVDLKLQVNVDQFVACSRAFVANISAPRPKQELEQLIQGGGCGGDESDGAEMTESSEASQLIHEFGALDLRVGVVLSAAAHPASSKLLVEQIDVGEESPRQVLSGIAEHLAPHDLVGQRVVVVCNLSPRNLRGLKSSGMILCARSEDSDQLGLVTVSGAPPAGTRVVAGDSPQAPISTVELEQRKLLQKIVPHLSVNAKHQAVVAGEPWFTSTTPAFDVVVDSGLSLPATIS